MHTETDDPSPDAPRAQPDRDTARCDIAVVGAGAAGIFAAIFAARSRARRVVVLDGARRIGAKVLVAGGGRCNVTHCAVSARDYSGSSRKAIDKVLRRFTVADTVAFFAQRGLELKQEDTGKLFPVTDRAQSVLAALLGALADAGAELRHPARVTEIIRADDDPAPRPDRPRHGFILRGDWGQLRAQRVVLATGGMSLPKTGSDGFGYALARRLGHTTTPRVFPALVPLVVPGEHVLKQLSGIAAPARVEVRTSTGRKLAAVDGAVLCTHFGLSGPAILDISRHLTDARAADPGATLHIGWLGLTTEDADDALLQAAAAHGAARIDAWMRDRAMPARLAAALAAEAGLQPSRTLASLRRDERRALAGALGAMAVPVERDRGWSFAEVTAGGVPLAEVNLATMESRICPGLHLCGEILDVDGRIGGFNFQWAWASGHVAGLAAARG